MQRKEHYLEGHVNAYTRDHDSIITHYGKHDRVVCFLPDKDGMHCRVDHVWGLGMPSVIDVLDVARKDQYVGGKWVLSAQETYESNGMLRTQFDFVKAAQ
jgi:hypothetical protein